MATFNAKAKPYKLQPTDGDNITRDDISTWSYTMMSCARQIKEWQQFLPGGTNHTWLSKTCDPTHGLVVKDNDDRIDEDKTNEVRSNLQDFLTFNASYCPSGFMNQIMRESTSFEWILDQLYETFGLQTKGENFLKGNDLKFEFNASFTYLQAYMKMKDFYVNSLLTKGKMFKGKELTSDEVLSPLAENFIIEKCLFKIDERLPNHVKNTRGHLFTEARPTLACNQRILFSQIDTMLSELDGKDFGASQMSVGQIRNNIPSYQNQRNAYTPQQSPRFMNSQRFVNRPPVWRSMSRGNRGGFRPTNNSGCIRCIEAGRYDASRFHNLNQCPYQRNFQNTRYNSPRMKVLLVQDQNTPTLDNNNQYEANYDNSYCVDPQAYAASVPPNEMGYDQMEMNMVNYGEHPYEEQL